MNEPTKPLTQGERLVRNWIEDSGVVAWQMAISPPHEAASLPEPYARFWEVFTDLAKRIDEALGTSRPDAH